MHTTVLPDQAVAFEKRLNKTGHFYLDAPIVGGKIGARHLLRDSSRSQWLAARSSLFASTLGEGATPALTDTVPTSTTELLSLGVARLGAEVDLSNLGLSTESRLMLVTSAPPSPMATTW